VEQYVCATPDLRTGVRTAAVDRDRTDQHFAEESSGHRVTVVAVKKAAAETRATKHRRTPIEKGLGGTGKREMVVQVAMRRE